MKHLNSILILLSLFICSTTQANAGDSIVHDNILYTITQHDDLAKVYEVEIAQLPMQEYVSTPAIVPYMGNEYKVTSFSMGLLPYCDDCNENGPDSTLHVTKIDLSKSVYIIGNELEYLMSGGIQIDTLILPPNLICPPYILTYYDEDKQWSADYKRKPCISTLILTNTKSNIHTFGFANLINIEKVDMSVVDIDSLNKPQKTTYSGVFEDSWVLKTAKLPEKIKYMGFATFNRCYNLINLKMPDSLEHIGNYALANTRLDSIYIPQKVNYISPKFISGSIFLQKIDVDSLNQQFESIDGVLFSERKDTIHSIPFSLPKDTLFFPKSVRSVNEFAFGLGNDGYGGVVSPSRWYLAYDTMEVIHHFYVNDKLCRLGEYAFYYSPLKSIKNFENTHVVSIPEKCFSGCLLDTIKFPIELISIKKMAFYRCKDLKYIEFTRAYVATIENGAFSHCVSLKKLDLSKQTRLKKISKMLCYNDSALEIVKLPRSIEKIETEAFKNCISLDTIEVPILEPISISEDVFEGVDKAKCKLIVPEVSVEKYRNAPVWKDFFSVEAGENMFSLEVRCDTTMGRVEGSGVYELGEKVNIYATPHDGYYLTGWSDAPNVKQQWRLITIESDSTITAHFAKVPTVNTDNADFNEKIYYNQQEKTLHLDIKTAETITIYDAMGKIVMTQKVDSTTKSIPLNLTTGIYIVTNKNQNIYSKIVIK